MDVYILDIRGKDHLQILVVTLLSVVGDSHMVVIPADEHNPADGHHPRNVFCDEESLRASFIIEPIRDSSLRSERQPVCHPVKRSDNGSLRMHCFR